MILTIRSATSADEAAVGELWRACGLVTSYNDPVTDFRFAKAGPCSDVLVGVDEGARVVGSVMVGHDGHRGWLYYVASSPDARGSGIGKRMVAAGEDWLRQRGVPKVMLMVRRTNAKVVPFYERLGFEDAPSLVLAKWLAR